MLIAQGTINWSFINWSFQESFTQLPSIQTEFASCTKLKSRFSCTLSLPQSTSKEMVMKLQGPTGNANSKSPESHEYHESGEFSPENSHDIGKSPFSIGNTSSFMVDFPASHVSLPEGIPKNPAPNPEQPQKQLPFTKTNQKPQFQATAQIRPHLQPLRLLRCCCLACLHCTPAMLGKAGDGWTIGVVWEGRFLYTPFFSSARCTRMIHRPFWIIK